MKILLDESLPLKLKYDFGTAHEVYTMRGISRPSQVPDRYFKETSVQ
jgi:hypothetical protein